MKTNVKKKRKKEKKFTIQPGSMEARFCHGIKNKKGNCDYFPHNFDTFIFPTILREMSELQDINPELQDINSQFFFSDDFFLWILVLHLEILFFILQK